MGKQTLASTADRKAMLGRLGKMRPDSPRQWGKMNAHQAVCRPLRFVSRSDGRPRGVGEGVSAGRGH